MKNQNDLIFSIVFAVLGLIAVGVAFATKPEVPPAPSVTAINTADAPLPTGTDPTMGLALGGGTTAGGAGGGFGGGMGGRGGGMMGGRGGYPGGGAGYPGGPPAGFSGSSGAGSGGMTPSAMGSSGMGGGK